MSRSGVHPPEPHKPSATLEGLKDQEELLPRSEEFSQEKLLFQALKGFRYWTGQLANLTISFPRWR